MLRELRKHGRALALCAVVQLLVGWLATRAYRTGSSSLAANGNWIVGKTEAERGLMGAWSYLTGRQAVAGEELHLEAWHGFQEVLSVRRFEGLELFEFDVALGRNAFAVAFFQRDGIHSYPALRLSTHPLHPSAFLEVEEDGAFVARRELSGLRLDKARRHHVRLDFEPRSVTAHLDGREVGRFELESREAGRVGFRGGAQPVAIDNVEVNRAGGGRLVDRFAATAAAGWMEVAVGLGLVTLSLVFFLVIARRPARRGPRLGFAFLMVSLTLLAITGILYGYTRLSAEWYPRQALLEEREEAYRRGEGERVVAELRQHFATFEGPRARRILFVGSSQTWGAGARRDQEALVPQVEKLLDAMKPGSRDYICLNLGVPSARARGLVAIVRDVLREVRPAIVVVNLSSNDKASKNFEPALRRLVEQIEAARAQPVLVLEANAPSKFMAGLGARHAEVRRLAEERGLPLIDLHGYLKERVDTGFLWWDIVHLTSYGQRLAARKIYEEIAPLVRQEIEAARKRKTAGRGSDRPE